MRMMSKRLSFVFCQWMLVACGGPPAPGADIPPVAVATTSEHIQPVATMERSAPKPRAAVDELWQVAPLDRNALLADLSSDHQSDLPSDVVLLLNDPDHRVRQDTIDELALGGHPQARALILLLLDDAHPAVREAAADALADLDPQAL